MRNRRRRRDASSGFPGVTWRRAARKWIAQPTVNGEQVYVGRFDTEQEAYAACLGKLGEGK